MKTFAFFLWIFLITTAGLNAKEFVVGGDIPRPGPIAFDEGKITILDAVAKAGLDLQQLRNDCTASNEPCPVRIILHRNEGSMAYDPFSELEKLRAEQTQLNDLVLVVDFRTFPAKIKERTKRLDQMINLGSTDFGDELMALAKLRHDSAQWKDGKNKIEPASLESFIEIEATRLVDEGKGKKIVSLLELKQSSLELEGHGPAHPSIRQAKQLIATFTDLLAKGK